ncbi:unnamed protein product [Caenorhabditis brenneri]
MHFPGPPHQAQLENSNGSNQTEPGANENSLSLIQSSRLDAKKARQLEQRFVMKEYQRNEPMDITNGMSYEGSSPDYVNHPRQSIRPIIPSIDYSAQSLDQCGRNRDKQHFDEEISDGWNCCGESSGAVKHSPGMCQRCFEEVTDSKS